ncbi:hypothetical protein [Variovorax sp. OV329]|uniref:hypothetical protein n=1 Tax=Variovorax sp. OV329 TaxID=1882825 RepID=UPI0008DF79CE|nr:hypothetical protein [Variovorax sp. OV329]SFM56820.1 hypothetical protein SAMN05444747_106253 [Variovorax sp. OV329]
MQNIEASVEELSAGAADFRDIVKQLDAATASLKKSSSVLRAEKLSAAVSSLTETIASLKALTQIMGDDSSEDIARAVTRAVGSAQSLRALLEKPSP